MIGAAIFDMDGLLFDTETLCSKAWKAVSARGDYRVADGLFFSCIGRNHRDIKSIVLDACGPDFPFDRFTTETREWMMERMTESGPPEKPGIRPLFDFLKARRIPIALATSTGEKSARWMIERAGLLPYFDAFAFGSEVEHGKPAPDIFLLARSRLGDIPVSTCAVFEDSPAGIRSAFAAGMRPVFVKDLLQPVPEVLALVWRQIGSLDEAASEEFLASM
jgi:HAD superfamily hydrolase (TIGR01509 family)